MTSHSDNLAEPITLNFHEATHFVCNNVCARHKTPLDISGFEGSFVSDQYHVRCVKCKEFIYEGGYVNVKNLGKIHRSEVIGEREMEDRPKLTKEQAIKDLFG